MSQESGVKRSQMEQMTSSGGMRRNRVANRITDSVCSRRVKGTRSGTKSNPNTFAIFTPSLFTQFLVQGKRDCQLGVGRRAK